MRWWMVLAATLMMAPMSAEAGQPMEQPMTCAVGGEKFTHTTTSSYSTFGMRPDGKPYGSWFFPLALPECPGNGLVMFDEFTPEQLAALPALIGQPDYQALRKADVPYYRAAWLMEKLGYPAHNVAWMVQQASWQADDRPALKRKYQAEFVERVRKLDPKLDPKIRTPFSVYAANALRELGRFDEAVSLLDAMDFTEFRKQAAQYTDNASSDDSREVEGAYLFVKLVDGLKTQSRAKNARSEALQLLSEDMVKAKCAHEKESLDSAEIAYCRANKLDE